jgi:hypothetical protein
MRQLRRNHQKQPTIDRLGAAPGAPRVTAAPVPTSWLRAASGPRMPPWLPFPPPGSGQLQGVPRVTAAPVPTSWLRASPGPARVPWVPAPSSRHRTAPGAPCVPVAPDRIKTAEPSSLENRAPDDFYFSTRPPA